MNTRIMCAQQADLGTEGQELSTEPQWAKPEDRALGP